MPPRFLVPALISGMILTVRTVSPTAVCSLFIYFVRVLVIPFGPSTRHEQSLVLCLWRILTSCSTQDMQCVENCDDPDPRRHVLYEQPVWQTLQMFRMSPLSVSTATYLSRSSSQLGKCFVRFFLFRFCPCLRPSWAVSGFLPVLYEFIAKRWRAGSIRLPEEDSDGSLADLSESQKLPPQELTGRRILLLWLPALCDLTGTTVRSFLRLRHSS
jgi:hypothetical protein